jgi:hypothetical protein
VKRGELRPRALTTDGRAAGAEKTQVRENLDLMNPVWVPGTNDIVYQLGVDRSVIRRVEACEGARPRDSWTIDGDFDLLSFSPNGGPVLAVVVSHDDSFWRIDLQAPEP